MRLLRPVLIVSAVALMLPGLATSAVAATGAGPSVIAQDNADRRDRGEDTKGENIDPITERPVKDSSVIDYVNDGYQFLAIIGGLLAVLMLIYAGYRYMTSYGDPEKISDAKDIVEKSLIGLGLLILAALILNTINPRTAEDPCRPGEAGCGDIDFSKPGGGANQIREQNR